jgi:DNA modification methylase
VALRIINTDVLSGLKQLETGSVNTIVTSPPYYSLRNYNLPPTVWDGPLGGRCVNCNGYGIVGNGIPCKVCDSFCSDMYPCARMGGHDFSTEKWYRTGGGAAGSSGEAFSAPGEANAARIKAARWHESTVCLRCGAWKGHLGDEPNPEMFVQHLVEVFREAKRVLRDDGTLWLNLGDSYAGSGRGPTGHNGIQNAEQRQGFVGGKGGSDSQGVRSSKTALPQGWKEQGLKSKDLIGIPWMAALALRADGWYLRQDIIWAKSNPMPESVRDRCTRSHEYIFMFSKSRTYYYDHEAIKEPTVSDHPSGNGFVRPARLSYDGRGQEEQWTGVGGTRNKRDVWTVPVRPFKGAHFATFPPKLVEPCILAGSPLGGTVLDPFMGSGTSLMVAREHGRNGIGLELNPDYCALASDRLGLSQLEMESIA